MKDLYGQALAEEQGQQREEAGEQGQGGIAGCRRRRLLQAGAQALSRLRRLLGSGANVKPLKAGVSGLLELRAAQYDCFHSLCANQRSEVKKEPVIDVDRCGLGLPAGGDLTGQQAVDGSELLKA
jgi:hypothetical protein